MHKEIEAQVKQAIQKEVFPGCVIGLVNRAGERTILPFGRLTYEPDSPAVTEDTIYDLASVTKSVPTAPLAAMFIKERRLRLMDRVRTYLPELQNDRDATIEDLLLYRVRGPRLSELTDRTPEEILAHVLAQGFIAPAGEPEYTNLPALLLGLVAERIGGDTLDMLAQRYFFGPLNMTNTSFFPTKNGHPMSIIAPTEINARGEVRGLPHDESAYVFAKAGRAAGYAGLFSTAPDMLNFLEALLRGEYPYIVRAAEAGLGWQLHEPYFMGTHAGAHTFGKTGFTGTSVVVDMARGIAFVILSNRTYPQRPPDAISPDCVVNIFRRDIANSVLSRSR